MKKLMLIVLMLALLATLIACGGEEITTATTETTEASADNVVKTEDYTATLNTAVWEGGLVDDAEAFDYFGTGFDVTRAIAVKYPNRTWFVQNADGTRSESTYMKVKDLDQIGAKVEEIAKDTVEVTVTEVKASAYSSWEKVTARAGSYLMFEFSANLPMDYYITVTPKEAGDVKTAVYTQDEITVKKASDGSFKGIAKCTVPYQKGKTYYINICMDKGKIVLASVPVEITPAKYDSPYRLQFIGEWDMIEDPDYLPNLIELFYNVYPRLYARFAFGTEPKEITFEADKAYKEVAYCAGTRVCVSVDYANSHPDDLGFFSHEITHSVQQYSALSDYGGETSYNGQTAKSWWTENMANYGGFRYFHWGYSTKFVQIYNVKTQSNLWNWGWEPYGDGSKLFLSYIDWKYPTTDENKDGKITTDEYGVIDLINYTIKSATTQFNDNPYNPDSPFNKAIATATGGECATAEALRQQYEADCKSGAWTFVGFRDYVDNFLTEGLGFVPDPVYPMNEKVQPGNITNPVDKQSDVTADTAVLPSGTNLALGAKVLEFSAEVSEKEGITKAFDGKLDTMWRGSATKTEDKKYQLMGFDHGFVIDLGEVKEFDTYVLVNAGIERTDSNNTVSWEILVSQDGRSFTSVDYQADAAADVVTVKMAMQSARYIELRVHKTDANNTGILRIHEFMVYKSE